MLFRGIMLTKSGPKVLEYNARFGDPETQAQLPLIKSNLAEIMKAFIEGKVQEVEVEMHNNECAVVVIAAGGYPGKYPRGDEIKMHHRHSQTGTTPAELRNPVSIAYKKKQIPPDSSISFMQGRPCVRTKSLLLPVVVSSQFLQPLIP